MSEQNYASWNPWHGCTKYSEGCRYCYVYRQDEAYGKPAASSLWSLWCRMTLWMISWHLIWWMRKNGVSQKETEKVITLRLSMQAARTHGRCWTLRQQEQQLGTWKPADWCRYAPKILLWKQSRSEIYFRDETVFTGISWNHSYFLAKNSEMSWCDIRLLSHDDRKLKAAVKYFRLAL